MKQRSPKPMDDHIGKRIRMRRAELKISQEDLGAAIGVSFQQVQKYEKGTNRVGAARLQQIADHLDTSVAFFMKATPGATAETSSVMDSFMATKDGITIAKAFVRIGDARIRATIAQFVDQISRAGEDALLQAAE